MSVFANRSALALGWMYGDPNTAVGTTQNSAAANWYALSFVADSARTLSTIRTYVSAVAGTLGGSDITCDLYDSTGTAGAPGSSIETGKVPTATITAAGWYTWTGFSTALTSGQQYWAVFKNANGTPASNNCTFRNLTALLGVPLLGVSLSPRNSWGRATSTNSGSTWSLAAVTTAIRVGYADGTFDGLPIHNVTVTAVGDGVYGARELGMKFVSPANASLKVAGVMFLVNPKTGSPTGSLRFGLWTGTTLLAYTQDFPNTGPNRWVALYFASAQTVPAGSVTRVTLAETTQADASGNRYNLVEFAGDTDTDSASLMPWNGTCTKTYFDGSSWTDSTLGTSIFGHALLLDSAGGFANVRGPVARNILLGGGIY